MAESKLAERIATYQPTKTTLFWSCVAAVALTAIVGFGWAGWVTAGTAEKMAADAAEESRAQLAATICVEQFLEAPDARAQLASLKEASIWSRESFIEKGGWATMPGMKEPVNDAAELCAQRLAAMELPAKEAATTTGPVAQ